MTFGVQTPSPDTAAAFRHNKQPFVSPCLPAHLGKYLKAQVQSDHTSAISLSGTCESMRNLSSFQMFFTHLTHILSVLVIGRFRV